MDKLFKVLLVEDLDDVISLILSQLQETPIEIFVAKTIEAAEELFAANSFDAILMDEHVPSDKASSTLALVRKIRERGYRGPIIATSKYEEDRKKLMESGCDYQVDNDGKRRAAEKLLEVLGLL